MLLHDQLKQAREREGLSQAKLAAMTGLSRNQIVRAEAGENITIDTLRRILVHLPIDEVTLLERVRIKVDYLNPAEKMFFGLGEILSHLTQATLSTMSLAMVAKDEMFLARDAEGRELDEKERADDARLVALLQRMESALVMMDVLRGVVYGSEAKGSEAQGSEAQGSEAQGSEPQGSEAQGSEAQDGNPGEEGSRPSK